MNATDSNHFLRLALSRGGKVQSEIQGDSMPFHSRFKRHGRGTKRPPAGTMNKVEAKYAEHLASLQRTGEIEWWKFEAVTLKLAPDCRLTVDFMVMMPDGAIQLHDTKGAKKKKTGGVWGGEYTFFAEEDAIIKLRTAAEIFPFRFFVVYLTPGGWEQREF